MLAAATRCESPSTSSCACPEVKRASGALGQKRKAIVCLRGWITLGYVKLSASEVLKSEGCDMGQKAVCYGKYTSNAFCSWPELRQLWWEEGGSKVSRDIGGRNDQGRD